MKLLLDPSTCGISGDMILGALIDLGADSKALERFNDIPTEKLGGSKIKVKVKKTTVNEFDSTSVSVEVENETHRSAEEMERVLANASDHLNADQSVKEGAKRALEGLLNVEKLVHAQENVHLHEEGGLDTIVDILGAFLLLAQLNVEEIYSMPVSVGGGRTEFSHGSWNVPVPAVLKIAEKYGIPLSGGPVDSEIATPTGMILLATMKPKFLTYYPVMIPKKVGSGAGEKRFRNVPNLLRTILFEEVLPLNENSSTSILETTIDDTTPEIIANIMNKAISEKRAIDGFVIPIIMKKGRPAYLLQFLLPSSKITEFSKFLMLETGTLGVRYHPVRKIEALREFKEVTKDVGGGLVTLPVKIGKLKDGTIFSLKAEYEMLNEYAEKLGIPLRRLKSIMESGAEE